MKRTLLKCGGFFDGSKCHANGTIAIVIQNGIIESIENYQNISMDVERESVVIEASQWTALPGMIDSHVHLVANPETRKQEFSSLDSEAIFLQTISNAKKAVQAGLTTVRDCGDPGRSVLSLRDAVHRGLIAGPDIIASGPVLRPTCGHMAQYGIKADGEREIIKTIRHLVSMGVDFIKVAVTGGGSSPGTDIFKAIYSLDELRIITKEAHRLGLRVAGHVHGRDGIKDAVEAGLDFIEHCSWVTPEGVSFDVNTARRMKEHSIRMGMTTGALHQRPLSGQRHELHGIWSQLRREYLLLVKRMRELGIMMTVGTDAGLWQVPLDSFYLALEGLVKNAGYKTAEALRAVTLDTALALGYKDRGEIIPGKRADIILVKGDPVFNLQTMKEVMLTIVGGRVVYRREG